MRWGDGYGSSCTWEERLIGRGDRDLVKSVTRCATMEECQARCCNVYVLKRCLTVVDAWFALYTCEWMHQS